MGMIMSVYNPESVVSQSNSQTVHVPWEGPLIDALCVLYVSFEQRLILYVSLNSDVFKY